MIIKMKNVSITFGNYKTVNVEVEVESDSEIEYVNVIQEDILLNIETVENLYKNSKLVNIMLKEFSNPNDTRRTGRSRKLC